MAPKPFRFGVIAETAAAHTGWLDLARRVEALGYSTLLIRDHLVADFFGDQLAPIPAVMAAAMVTTTLRVGTLVIDNDFRHPALLAKEIATIDVLSGGRVELGIGAGWLAAEYTQAGIPFDQPGVRIDRLVESIAIMKALWSGQPVQHHGTHYQIDDLVGYPLPRQHPHPPILIGGGGPKVLGLAGREADSVGILTTSVTTGTLVSDPAERRSAQVAAKVAIVRDAAGARFPQVELSLVADTVVTDHRRAATGQLIGQRGWGGLDAEDVWDMPAVLIGSADEIAETLRGWRETLGFSYIIVGDADLDAFAPVVARLSGS